MGNELTSLIVHHIPFEDLNMARDLLAVAPNTGGCPDPVTDELVAATLFSVQLLLFAATSGIATKT